ncbi:MAG: c-type cytochrome [Candidatus Acidiferrales bacterium]
MLKAFVVGALVGVLVLMGSAYYYFASGMAPAAVHDPMMPFEKKMASLSLNAHIDNAKIPAPPIPANDENLLAGAKLYKDQCSMCHGLPNQTAPMISDNMFPHAPLLFKGKGVTDDPPQESYWKVANGIRLTGMPSFKSSLSDTQMWQIALLVANADKIPDSAKTALMPGPSADSMAPAAEPAKGADPKKR